MSESEFSYESYNSWQPISVGTQNVTDGVNLRELVLDGLDSATKIAIIDFLKGYQLEVKGVDDDTYTVDMTKWDRNKSEQFVQLLKTMGGKLPEMLMNTKDDDDDDDDEPHSMVTETSVIDPTVISAITSNDSTEEGKIIFDELRPKRELDIPLPERRIPIQPHPPGELNFEYVGNIQPFPVQTAPIYQKDELLNIKPMLMTEDTQSTMGSANVGVRKVKKSLFSIKCVISCLSFPFRLLKRLKIFRYIRKQTFKRKSKEEKMRKEKAFAVYSTLLEKGPRYGREFRASLKQPTSAWRTVATNTWAQQPGDDWSVTSEVLKTNRGINAVCQIAEIGINTHHIKEAAHLREIPKVFSEPEEEPIVWCPCQFITSSFLYKCISKCLNYICDWELCNTELIKQDIASQKEELVEVRSMLMGALELLERARKSNNDNNQ
ncbi:unnamed protein product [Nezara viridula]|uniref:Uncharacterized protein n=1 Tax=Nezara viridula TaxID=85310 RepID=A0A9P0MVI5_NEZVI|nr:unnamed protein product [Nezara viridula]